MKIKMMVALLFCWLVIGCANSLESILNNYNGNFEIEKEPDETPLPGDHDFDADTMLDDYYLVVAKSDNTVFELAAPEARSYTWILTSDYEILTNINYFEGMTKNSKNFVIRLSDSGLKIPGTYNLSLTVTDKGGTRYVDNCKLYIVLP